MTIYWIVKENCVIVTLIPNEEHSESDSFEIDILHKSTAGVLKYI